MKSYSLKNRYAIDNYHKNMLSRGIAVGVVVLFATTLWVVILKTIFEAITG